MEMIYGRGDRFVRLDPEFQLGHVLSDMEMIYGRGDRFVRLYPEFQLGHVLSDMEIDGGADVTSYYVQFQVSIGPRPFGHGNQVR